MSLSTYCLFLNGYFIFTVHEFRFTNVQYFGEISDMPLLYFRCPLRSFRQALKGRNPIQYRISPFQGLVR